MAFLKGLGIFLLVWLGGMILVSAIVPQLASIAGGISLAWAVVLVFVVGMLGGLKGKPKEAPEKKEA
jgi:hypothetical protein